jgi:hypothetical protein
VLTAQRFYFHRTFVPGVAFVESDSQPGIFYQLTGVGRGPVTCTCKGFTFHLHCKHSRAAVSQFPVRISPDVSPAPLYGGPVTAA